MDALLTKLQAYVPVETLVTLTVASLIGFIGTLIAIPFILVRLPADYFDIRVPRPWMRDHHPVLRLFGHIVKNLIGVVFLLAGLAMLFLPGQGILTMLLGVTMLDFPGKRRVEAKLVGQPTIWQAINKMRERFGEPPLVIAADP